MAEQFEKTMYGFWKQQNPKPFSYSEQYRNSQSTNDAMSWFRIGWLSAALPYTKLREFRVVDVGAGNLRFTEIGKRVFRDCVPYDVEGEQSISTDELYQTNWDIACLFDVLEHFQDINDLFRIPATYYYLSFPETPDDDTLDMIGGPANWKHYKPNEHIWCLNRMGICEWLEDKGYAVLQAEYPEDVIRTRWCPDVPNIASVLARKQEV